MARRILWRSWCRLEAGFELERMSQLPMSHEWVNAHEVMPEADDIWLTTNGYDYRQGPFKKASLYAESYQYLRGEYDRYNSDPKWDHRFHFNPHYYTQDRTSQQGIGAWWKQELELFEKTLEKKNPEFTFGMVLSKKPLIKKHPCEFGWFRTEVVNRARSRSFKYFGAGWEKGDPFYGGEVYVHGHRGTPLKFHDARILMTKAKFVFALENIHDDHFSLNYLTEKIFHGFLSASVPIYAGCGNVAELINPNLFIDLRKFDLDVEKVMDFCEKMSDSEYAGYLERIAEFLYGPAKALTCDERFLELDRKLGKIFG